jgi:hypothetical protein
MPVAVGGRRSRMNAVDARDVTARMEKSFVTPA